jgi:hypothetical protein
MFAVFITPFTGSSDLLRKYSGDGFFEQTRTQHNLHNKCIK